MKRYLYIFAMILCIYCVAGLSFSYYMDRNAKPKPVPVKEYVVEDIKVVRDEDSRFNKLMIVAHPDDETLFGGAHLLSDEYVVVCVTCGVKQNRLDEYINVMNFSEDKYVYLAHTDLEPGAIISDWKNEKDIINEELDKIIKSRDWDIIVTHNPEGEYGHKHHKMISQMVTNNVEDKDKLYYFGKFYKKGTINDAPVMDKELYKKKREMLALYVSQKACTDESSLTYMFDHENWLQYSDWK